MGLNIPTAPLGGRLECIHVFQTSSNGAKFGVDSGSKVGVRASYYLSTCLMHPLGTLACQTVVSVHFSTIPCPYKARANSTLKKGVDGPGLLGHHAFTTWILSKRSRIQAQCLSKNLHITNPPTKHCHRYTKFAGYTSVFLSCLRSESVLAWGY